MARGSPGLHVPEPLLPNFTHRRRANAGGRRNISVAQPTRRPAKEAAGHKPPCHWAKWLWAGPDCSPACMRPGQPECPWSARPLSCPRPRPCRFRHFPAYFRYYSNCVQKLSVSNDLNVSSGDVCALLPAAACPRPHYRRSRAVGCPRRRRRRAPGLPAWRPGLAGWPRPQGCLVGRSGLCPDPEPRAHPTRGGIVQL